jgi:hypothetical protein
MSSEMSEAEGERDRREEQARAERELERERLQARVLQVLRAVTAAGLCGFS